MGQGDTTIRVDMEVGGTSSAKMSVQDFYRTSEAAMTKAAVTESRLSDKQIARQREKARLSLAAQKSRALEKQLIKAEADAIADKNKKEAAAASLQAQRSRALIANLKEEERERKRIARLRERDEMRISSQRGIMGRVMHAGMMGIAGYAGVAGVARMFSSISEGMTQFIDKRAELEKAIVPVVMLEDKVSSMGKIRQEVSGTAVALGRSYQEVGEFYSELVGTTGNLNQSERDSLVKETKELADLTGGSLVTAQNLLTKSYQIYGKELVNVNQLQNKLMVTQDQASITFEDMALRLPELLQAGKFADMSIDEVLGTVVAATRKSGSIEKTMTGMRNFFLIMEEAQKKGITLTGTYVEKLATLADMFQTNKAKMQELFGKEVVVHASSITDAFGETKTAIEEVGRVTSETDQVFDKLLKRASDPAWQQFKTFQIIDDARANAPNTIDDAMAGSPMMNAIERMKYGQLYFDKATAGFFGDYIGGVIGAIGGLLVPGNAGGGKAMTQGDMSMPDLVAAKRRDFFAQKEADIGKYRQGTEATVGYRANTPENRAMYEEAKNRQLSPHLMSEEERRIYKETGVGPTSAQITAATSVDRSGATTPVSPTGNGQVEDTETHKLLREQNALLRANLPKKTGDNLKVGGGKNNAEESLGG